MGNLSDDEPLDEARLLARFPFGRTPLREALKHLSDEQFINWPAHGTPYVRGIRAAELSRIYEARLILEGPVARLAAERRTEAQVVKLVRVMDELSEAIRQDDVYLSVELDHDFHLTVASATDNRFLEEAVGRLNCGSLRLWYLSHSVLGMEGVNTDHQGILDAIRDRDPASAEQASVAHIQKSYNRQIDRQRIDLNQLTVVHQLGENV